MSQIRKNDFYKMSKYEFSFPRFWSWDGIVPVSWLPWKSLLFIYWPLIMSTRKNKKWVQAKQASQQSKFCWNCTPQIIWWENSVVLSLNFQFFFFFLIFFFWKKNGYRVHADVKFPNSLGIVPLSDFEDRVLFIKIIVKIIELEPLTRKNKKKKVYKCKTLW